MICKKKKTYRTQLFNLQVEVLAKAIKSWSGSGSVRDLKIVGGKLN